MMKTLKSVRLALLAAAALFTVSAAKAQDKGPVTWTCTGKQTAPNEYLLSFTAAIEKGWHIYSQYLPEADVRPVPTSFAFKDSAAVHFVHGDGERLSEEGTMEEVYDSSFEMKLIYYSGKVVFTQKVKLLKPLKTISGFIEYMCCNDKMCLPPKEQPFSLKVTWHK